MNSFEKLFICNNDIQALGYVKLFILLFVVPLVKF